MAAIPKVSSGLAALQNHQSSFRCVERRKQFPRMGVVTAEEVAGHSEAYRA